MRNITTYFATESFCGIDKTSRQILLISRIIIKYNNHPFQAPRQLPEVGPRVRVARERQPDQRVQYATGVARRPAATAHVRQPWPPEVERRPGSGGRESSVLHNRVEGPVRVVRAPLQQPVGDPPGRRVPVFVRVHDRPIQPRRSRRRAVRDRLGHGVHVVQHAGVQQVLVQQEILPVLRRRPVHRADDTCRRVLVQTAPIAFCVWSVQVPVPRSVAAGCCVRSRRYHGDTADRSARKTRRRWLGKRRNNTNNPAVGVVRNAHARVRVLVNSCGRNTGCILGTYLEQRYGRSE